MATVTGYTAARIKQVEDESVISGNVDSAGNLLLERRDGEVILAGNVKGPQGDPALPPDLGTEGIAGNLAVVQYIRVAYIDGINDTNGSQVIFDFIGGSSFGSLGAYSAKVHISQRLSDTVKVDVIEHGDAASSIEWYTRKLSAYVFEIWVKLPAYSGAVQLQPLMEWHGTVEFDQETTTPPSNILTTSVSRYSDGIVRKYALLDPTYKGPGPAKVISLPENILSTEKYEWEGKFEAWGNRTVELERRGTTWAIAGHSQNSMYGGKQKIELFGGWGPYTYRVTDSSFSWPDPRVQRLSSGIVILSGLIAYGTGTGGTKIGQLPPGTWPDTNMLFPVNNGDTPRTIAITTIGEILIDGGNMNGGTYISFDGVAYPAAGVATWTTIGAAGSGSGFLNGWSGYNTSSWGPPRYWKDPYGFVWYAGIIGGGSTASDNLPFFDVPAAYRAEKQTHTRAASASNFGFVSALPSSGLSWKIGTSSGVWVSLCGITVATADAVNNNSWQPILFANGWAQYDTFPTAAVLRRADGLATSKGLIKSGTVGLKITALTRDLLPETSQILYGVSAQSFMRLDMEGLRSAQKDANYFQGTVRSTGSNAWVSLDGLMWMVGD